MDKITIGIPSYNAEATIGRAIRSALAQDWENIEVLVVDDASSDSSPEIVERLGKANPQIRFIPLTANQGVGAVRNRITREAAGQWIAFFDDDDQSAPSRVRLQRERILAEEEATGTQRVACYASGRRVYPNGYTLEIEAIGSSPIVPQGEEVADYLLFNQRRPGVSYGRGTPASALMARKSTFESVGGFDPKFRRVEDTELAIRLALNGAYFVGCPEKLYTQFATTGGDKTAEANLEAELQIFEKHKDYLQAKKRYGYARDWFQFRYYHFKGNEFAALLMLLRCWLGNPVQVTKHFLRSAPRRFVHELRMGAFGKPK